MAFNLSKKWTKIISHNFNYQKIRNFVRKRVKLPQNGISHNCLHVESGQKKDLFTDGDMINFC